MKAKDVDFFEKVQAQVQQLHSELSILSKGKPDNPINTFKLNFINEKLDEANAILAGEFKPFKNFNRFEEANLPSNSDAVLILAQYLDCLEAWRCANIKYVYNDASWNWKTDDGTSITTKPPSRYRKVES